MKRHTPKEELWERVSALHATGATWKEIGAALGRNSTNIRQTLKRDGYELPRRARASNPVTIPDDIAIRAYLAGIIDGEGSISRTVAKARWSVVVYSTDKNLIDWCCAFGGLDHIRPVSKTGFATKRDQYGWTVNRREDIVIVLEAILPYLIIKKDKAMLALKEVRQQLQPPPP